MRALLLLSSPNSFFSHQCHHRCFWFSSIFHINYNHFSSSSSSSVNNPNPIFIDYLINTFGFSKSQADSASEYFQSRKGPNKPDSVVHLLQEFRFSETHIRQAVLVQPRILFAKVEKTLKPKLSFFQKELGLTGSDLGLFISNNPRILNASLERRLIPNINILKKFIENEDGNMGQFIPLQRRFQYQFFQMDPNKLLSNISFLQSCGIVGSQLFTLFKREPTLFIRKESALRDLVLNAQEMGFSCNSRMLVHALCTLHKISSQTLENKVKLLRSFGFSQEECSAMSRSQPALLLVSDKKLKFGIDFFDSAGFERKMLVHNPICLMVSLEKRVIPRFRVYQILKSKQQQLLTNKCPSFSSFLVLTEKRFLEKHVYKFGDNAKELLAAYNNGNVLNSSLSML